MTYYTLVPSPIDPLLLTSDGRAITGVHMDGPHGVPPDDAGWRRADDLPVLSEARRQLEEYFAGRRQAFDLPLALAGTPFQQRVWAALAQIPYGATLSYGELARNVQCPGGARAVGLANGRNPVAIVIPCHRVIGADGRLTGFGGGLDRKAALLQLEAGVLAGTRAGGEL